MGNFLEIHFTDERNVKSVGVLDKLPNECPQCHSKISPLKGEGHQDTSRQDTDKALEVVFRCPDATCRMIFIGYYAKERDRNSFIFKDTAPKKYSEKTFPDNIKDISPNFEQIYNQALSAEMSGLDQICGAGYRKALEFLIKDYLIKQTDDAGKQEEIKQEQLGSCIKNRIGDKKIKEVAKRAVWLGNDETHYSRKWDKKDLQDLKNLIDLTIHWVEAEALTAQLLEDMPDKVETTA